MNKLLTAGKFVRGHLIEITHKCKCGRILKIGWEVINGQCEDCWKKEKFQDIKNDPFEQDRSPFEENPEQEE